MTNNGTGSGRTAAKVVAWVLGGILGLLVLTYVIDVAVTSGTVPRGTTVRDVEIGGLSYDEAEERLESELGGLATQPVAAEAGELRAEFVPEEAGLLPNWSGTVEAAGRASLNPITRIKGLFGTVEVDVVTATQDDRLASAAERVAGELSREMRDAGISLEGGEVEIVEPETGQRVDAADAADAMEEHWLDEGAVSVDYDGEEPSVGRDAAEEAANGPAARAVSGEVRAKGAEDVDGVIPTERMGEVVSFKPDDGRLKADVDVDAARGILNENLGETEKELRNANYTSSGGELTVTPHQDGRTIDWEKTLENFPERVIGDAEREFDVSYDEEKASFTTEQAERATFDEAMGEFTTSGFSRDSGINIRRISDDVSGTLLLPGETFSLNGRTEPRGKAQGYVESGIIQDGHADTAVGGGISQYATTLYNATYFAGLEDVAHTPHSYYINRYPAGREATVFEGQIDLKFKNPFDIPVRIESQVDGNSVTVRIMGQKQVDVESVNGGRWNETPPQRQNVGGENCQPSSGAPGFTTSDTRIIRDLSGNEISREETTTVYDPQPIVTCS